MSATLTHLQSAIDRAYLEEKRGKLQKHARLHKDDYAHVDFTLLPPREGGFIQEIIGNTRHAITDRIGRALERAYVRVVNEEGPIVESLAIQAQKVAGQLNNGVSIPTQRQQLVDYYNSEERLTTFAERSILKEFDQTLSQIRIERYAGSTLEISVAGKKTYPLFEFDAARSERFHTIVSERTVGNPVLLRVTIRALDEGGKNSRPTGKATDLETGKDFNILFSSDNDFNLLVPYVKAGQKEPVEIIAVPILEYQTFDPISGDMFFIGLNSL